MARKDAIEVEGTVVELLANTMFRSTFKGAVAWRHISRQIAAAFIRMLPGGKIMLEISPYDLSKGRINYRQNDNPAGCRGSRFREL